MKILKNPSEHPATMSPVSLSKDICQIDAGSCMVCSQMWSFQILIDRSSPPEM